MLTPEMLLEEKAELESERARIEKRLLLIKELIKCYPASDEPLTEEERADLRFFGMRTVDAIFEFLREKPNTYFTAEEIAAQLLKGGIEANRETLSSSIAATCKKKVEAEKLESNEKRGEPAFRLLK